MFRYFLPIAISLALSGGLMAQQMIELKNPSFENIPSSASIPSGWYACGQLTDNPPAILPGSWGVNTPAKHGSTYLGLVVRDNRTWEGVSQRLRKPLVSGQCYRLSMEVCRSEQFTSVSPLSAGTKVPFTAPARIRIWGGNSSCEKIELLDQTNIISNIRWETVDLHLHPQTNSYKYLLIEAYYDEPTNAYNGHVLVDKISPIYLAPCD